MSVEREDCEDGLHDVSQVIAVCFVCMGIGRTPNRQRLRDLDLGGIRTSGCTPTIGKRMQCTGLVHDCWCEAAQALTSCYHVDAKWTLDITVSSCLSRRLIVNVALTLARHPFVLCR